MMGGGVLTSDQRPESKTRLPVYIEGNFTYNTMRMIQAIQKSTGPGKNVSHSFEGEKVRKNWFPRNRSCSKK